MSKKGFFDDAIDTLTILVEALHPKHYNDLRPEKPSRPPQPRPALISGRNRMIPCHARRYSNGRG